MYLKGSLSAHSSVAMSMTCMAMRAYTLQEWDDPSVPGDDDVEKLRLFWKSKSRSHIPCPRDVVIDDKYWTVDINIMMTSSLGIICDLCQ